MTIWHPVFNGSWHNGETKQEYWKYTQVISSLNIDQQLFLNEADLAENHLIQLWLKNC